MPACRCDPSILSLSLINYRFILYATLSAFALFTSPVAWRGFRPSLSQASKWCWRGRPSNDLITAQENSVRPILGPFRHVDSLSVTSGLCGHNCGLNGSIAFLADRESLNSYVRYRGNRLSPPLDRCRHSLTSNDSITLLADCDSLNSCVSCRVNRSSSAPARPICSCADYLELISHSQTQIISPAAKSGYF